MKSTPFWVGKFDSREAMEAAFRDAELDRLDAEREAEIEMEDIYGVEFDSLSYYEALDHEDEDDEDAMDRYWENLLYQEAPDGAW